MYGPVTNWRSTYNDQSGSTKIYVARGKTEIGEEAKAHVNCMRTWSVIKMARQRCAPFTNLLWQGRNSVAKIAPDKQTKRKIRQKVQVADMRGIGEADGGGGLPPSRLSLTNEYKFGKFLRYNKKYVELWPGFY